MLEIGMELLSDVDFCKLINDIFRVYQLQKISIE
jgi:hypothetical protein